MCLYKSVGHIVPFVFQDLPTNEWSYLLTNEVTYEKMKLPTNECSYLLTNEVTTNECNYLLTYENTNNECSYLLTNVVTY